MTTKFCRRCEEDKPSSAFHMRSTGALVAWCKPCTNRQARQDQKQYAARHTASRRHTHWLKRYGLAPYEYHVMLEMQGGRCAICKSDVCDKWSEFFAIDHDHVTGKVRGLLCTACNRGLGYYYDRPELLNAAADYLKKVKV